MTQSRTMASQTMAHLLGLLGILLLNIHLASARGVVVEPNPNKDVGMMTTDTKYFNCKGERNEIVNWYGPNGKEITTDQTQRVFVVRNRNKVKLELKGVVKGDSGTYQCMSRSKNGQPSGAASFKLHIFNPTEVSGTTHYIKSEGARFLMECTANSDKDATVEFAWNFGAIDLATDPGHYRIETVTQGMQNNELVKTVSRLEIKNVTKEHDGKYTCSVDTTNAFLSDEKELKIQLRVQYKPRFDEKTPRYIWVSEEAVQQGGMQTVNISCIVAADPVAKITWYHGTTNPIVPTGRTPGSIGNIRPTIADNENLSVLSLRFPSIEDIRRGGNRNRYTCRASNEQGEAMNTFEIKVGRIPDAPQIVAIDYKEGAIHLQLNESHVEPQIDIYRLEIEPDQAHLFNKSTSAASPANNTYIIELRLPRGEHKVNLFAHNPVGWSENPHSSYFLTVINSAGGNGGSWAAILLAVGLGQLVMRSRSMCIF